MLLGAPAPIVRLLNQRIAMRDSVQLDTHVFHPNSASRFPAILIRTPYGKGLDLLPSYEAFVNRGYAMVVQDVRGRYLSDGTFDALDQEGADGYDTLNWIARQPWSDGKVGMLGGSYLGISQWKVAVLNNPHLKAIFPIVSGYDDYLDRFYSPGGAEKLGHRLLWFSENLLAPGVSRPKFESYIYHVPLRTADHAATGQTVPMYQRIQDHPTYDSFWKKVSVREKIDRVHVPVFSVGGWYDNYIQSDLEAFSILSKSASRKNGQQRILVGPWPHSMSVKFAGVDFGQDSSAPLRAYQLEWFDHWLKGAPEQDAIRQYSGIWHNVRSEVTEAPVQIFVMGANRWRDEQEWPLARTLYTPLYLAGKGHANSLGGDGLLEWKLPKKDKADQFLYDPQKPVPTMGGAVCCNPKIFPWGPMDQRTVERRSDVLVYTTKPLKRALEVTGPVRVMLYAATSMPDTDFTAKIVDVFPNGDARNLTDGLIRLRYRAGIQKAVLARPGEIYPITIDAGVTSNVFLPGHRIRLEVSSSNFPRFDRNPNTGRPIADETVLKKAEQTVYHSPQFPSHMILPVVPELTSTTASRYGAKKNPTDRLTFKAR